MKSVRTHATHAISARIAAAVGSSSSSSSHNAGSGTSDRKGIGYCVKVTAHDCTLGSSKGQLYRGIVEGTISQRNRRVIIPEESSEGQFQRNRRGAVSQLFEEHFIACVEHPASYLALNAHFQVISISNLVHSNLSPCDRFLNAQSQTLLTSSTFRNENLFAILENFEKLDN